jgi:hypothetical protein
LLHIVNGYRCLQALISLANPSSNDDSPITSPTSKCHEEKAVRQARDYEEIGKTVRSALSSWAKTYRLCIIMTAAGANLALVAWFMSR